VENNITLLMAGALVALALIAGVVYKTLSGRGREVSSSEVIDLKKLRAEKNGLAVTEFGKRATMLMFSTDYCGQCPGVRRHLAQLEYRHGQVAFIEVDISDRLDLAAHFSINQTPTVFILDPEGHIKFRVSGVPKPGVIQQELDRLTAL
jgi:thiol-disulfide isomerase/thioredoxin